MDTNLLTYKELADRMGVKIASARKLVQRKHWKRITGNDGIVRIAVPLDYIQQRDSIVPTTVPTTVSTDDMDRKNSADLENHLEVRQLQETIISLEELVSEARLRADAEARRASDLENDRDYWRKYATRSIWSKIFGN